MRALLAAATLSSIAAMAQAQEFKPSANLSADVRIEYQNQSIDGSTDDATSGFKGRYLYLDLNGEISSKFSYKIRQCLNKSIGDKTMFDATNWAYINYDPTERWTLSAGKQVVAIGGCEYDKSSIDIYRGSEFWHNVGCYQFGVSAAYNFRGGNDMLLFQVSQSPASLKDNMYAYNLLWNGTHGALSTFYSANLVQVDKQRYISYIVVGNKIEAGPATLELDFMNRASSHQTYLFRDCSVMAELGVMVSSPVRLFAKYLYDVNRTGTDADCLVFDGTEVTQVGAGIEYHAFRNSRNDVRLHACYYHTWGTNSNPDATAIGNASLVNIGIKWHVDVFRTGKK